MGFWNEGVARSSRSRSRSRSHSRSRTHSPSHKKTHYASRPAQTRSTSSSFFSGMGGSTSNNGGGTSRGRSHSYSSRARPRAGFIAKLRKFLRDLYSYMRRHPVKVFVLVIMPLITGGALTKILAQFGVRLPRALESMVRGGAGGMRGGGAGDRFFARGGARDFGGGSALPGMGGGMGQSVQGLLSVAKMFM